MNRILKKTLALAALFCLTLGLAGCQSGAGKTLEQAGTALKTKTAEPFSPNSICRPTRPMSSQISSRATSS